ncbi:MAG: hypothetical protein OET90_08870 [Desulfuromonadales bacterium]|nr:hypothetical protein [Desulfuromonadales bacterium]
METYTLERVFPSCTLNRELLSGLERRLLQGIPRLLHNGLQKLVKGLGLESYKKLEHYQLYLDIGEDIKTYAAASEMAHSYFDAKTHQVRLSYRLSAPRVLEVDILFRKDGQPRITLSTQSPQIEMLLPKIADGLSAVIETQGTRHRLLHHGLLQAIALLLPPLAVLCYGLFSGVDFFLLCSSMGWLCLFSLGITMLLPHLFPWVVFESRRRFQLARLPLLLKFSLFTVAAACYVGLLLLNLPQSSEPVLAMLAGLLGAAA